MSRRRFVVICPQGLGDSLQATPMLASLRAARPDAHIEVVVLRQPVQALFAGLPALVDRVRYLPYWERGSRAFALTAARIPFAATADATFLTYPAARAPYAFLHALFRTRARYAHDYPEARPLRRYVPTTLSPLDDRHNVLRNLALLVRAGIPIQTPHGYTVPPDWIAREARQRDSVVLHVGSIVHDGFDRKRWPERSFSELARRLVNRGLDVAFLSGPQEREVTARVQADAPATRIIQGDLPSVARQLSRAGLVVANDNGIAHLAAGVGTPVVALFGPTPLTHAPFGPSAAPLRPSDCPPCFSPIRVGLTCIREIDYRCLKIDLSVDIAEAAALASLERTRKDAIPSTP